MNALDTPLVMLVDDNDIDLFLNKKFLRVAGITDNTINFNSALEALNYLKHNANFPEKLPDSILLDIQMPIINGFEFMELFTEIPDHIKDHVSIYMLSSSTDPVDIQRAQADPLIVDILCKPLDPLALKTVLGKVA